MINFSIALIAKNEEKTLPRLMSSLQEYMRLGGEVIYVDTGSTDNTIKVANQLGIKTFEVGNKFILSPDQHLINNINNYFVPNEEPIVPPDIKIFNYSAARNYAASLTKHNMIAMPDCDEAYTMLDINKLCSLINDGAEQLEYNFVFSHNAQGQEAVKFLHCKFYDRRKLHWIGTIHEMLEGQAKRMFLDENIIKLEHYQNHSSDRSHYLSGLAYDCYMNPENDRNAHYMGRELLWRGRYKAAIKQLERHVAMNRWIQEAAQSLIFIGQCYGYMKDEAKQIEYYLKAFIKDSSRRESLIQLCELYRTHDDFQKVACFAEAALTISWNGYYHNLMAHYREAPHCFLYWAYWYLGNKERSKYHYEEALKYAPNNPQILWDARVSEPWISELPDGWFSIVDVREYRRLVEMIPDNGLIIELGCWKGRSICSIADQIIRKNLSVVLVDTFQGTPGEIAHAFAKTEDIKSILIDNLKKFKIYERCQIVPATTDEAAGLFTEQTDMIFIDADHSYESVRSDIINWDPKLKENGILCGHDYLWPGPNRAVNEILANVHINNNIWSVKT